MEKDGFQIELFEYKKPKHPSQDSLQPNTDLQTIGTKHAAFSVTEMETLKKQLEESGVPIAHEAVMNGDRVVFIRDCNGILIELIEPASEVVHTEEMLRKDGEEA